MTEQKKSVGFVSLGCPKALVDSERILTQLKLEGYEVAPSYEGADAVVVNTCGFIDSAKQESLDAINEAMRENGKVIVTGCMGKGSDAEAIKQAHPDIVSVTGPADYDSVLNAVHQVVPPKPEEHNPLVDLVPPQGVKLTPQHYAYLKISEGCNHRCTFCIIPDMRGDLVSRPLKDVVEEAKTLVQNGVQELLVISQDTSAYGVDTRYKIDFVDGQAYETRMQDLAVALGELGVWVRMHYVYPYPHVDKVIPLMAEGKILPYLDIPFQHASPSVLKRMKRPAHSEKVIERIQNGERSAQTSLFVLPLLLASQAKPKKIFSSCLIFLSKRSSTALAALSIHRLTAPRQTNYPTIYLKTFNKNVGNVLWPRSKKLVPPAYNVK